MATMMNAFESELEYRNNDFYRAIERGIELLQTAQRRTPSDHLGHNLGSVAAELSVIAGKIASTQAALAYLRLTTDEVR